MVCNVRLGFTSEINIPLRPAVVVKAQLVWLTASSDNVYQCNPVTTSIRTVKCGLYDSYYGKHHLRFVEITNSMLVHISEFVDTTCVND